MPSGPKLIMAISAFVLLGALSQAAMGAQGGKQYLDLFKADGTRHGYAIVRPDTGRLDVYDVRGNRTGYGRITPDGTLELFSPEGRRLDPALVKPSK